MNIDSDTRAYVIGGGIASLSCAVYLLQEGKLRGEQVTVLYGTHKLAGSLDAQVLKEKGGYVMRGIRMFEEKSYTCTFDLMSRIPSVDSPEKTLRDEFVEHNEKNGTYLKSRLVRKGEAVGQRKLSLPFKDRLRLLTLPYKPEVSIEHLALNDYFSPDFFSSNFWYEFCTVFAFERWHSLIEFRRYFMRFIHDFPRIDTLEDVELTPYNQYESLVGPVVEWLKSKGVIFEEGVQVTDFDFVEDDKGMLEVRVLHTIRGGEQGEIQVAEKDFVFTTLGSMTASSNVGSMHEAPQLKINDKSIAWTLWNNISKKHSGLGNPEIFNAHVEKSKWISFTVTLRDDKLIRLLEKYFDSDVTNFGGVSLISSNWFVSIVTTRMPHFKDQEEGVHFCWGYGLYPDKVGNYVQKKMSECTGEEILTEVMYHLGFIDELEAVKEHAVCIPCMTPFVTSQFLPRGVTDRPQVVPEFSKNFAFLGQYCEIPKDVVFTVDYSVRSAQTAVYTLLGLDKKVTPIYKGLHHVSVIFNALRTLFR